MSRRALLIKILFIFSAAESSVLVAEDSYCTKDDNRSGVCKVAGSCPQLEDGGSSGGRRSRRPSCFKESLVCCPSARSNSIGSLIATKKMSHNDKCGSLATSAPPDPRSGCCGREVSVTNRIVGGKDTSMEQYPWMAILEYRNENNRKLELTCGGFLISTRYVVTAKHCVQGPNMRSAHLSHVHLAEYDTKMTTDCVTVEGGGEDCINMTAIAVESVTAHPDQDIALIKLKAPAPYTDFIRPICLPNKDITEDSPAGVSFFVAGWGLTGMRPSRIKRQLEVPFVPMEKCKEIYEHTKRPLDPRDEQICAGGVEGQDSCRGDSGGPLMLDNGDYMEAAGIISFGDNNCGRKGIPAVHTNVHKNLAWIRMNIEQQTGDRPYED